MSDLQKRIFSLYFSLFLKVEHHGASARKEPDMDCLNAPPLDLGRVRHKVKVKSWSAGPLIR